MLDRVKRSATGYTPATAGPVTRTTVTDPLGHSVTSTMEPAWNLATSIVDDALGHVQGDPPLTADGHPGRMGRCLSYTYMFGSGPSGSATS